MKNKLNHIISIILLSVTLFTGCEKTESVSEETTVSETTAATIPADLTEEEMAIWESMPDIVTMRVYNDFITETTEILYITKYGEMKSFTLEGNSENYHDTEWINEEIENNEVQAVETASICQLIELYNTVSLIDIDSQLICRQTMSLDPQRPNTYNYVIYTLYNKENVCISRGHNTKEYIMDGLYGENVFKIYLNIDPFKQSNDTGISY